MNGGRRGREDTMRAVCKLVLTVVGLLLLAPWTAGQAVDVDWFLTIQTVPGCSTVPNQLGKIDILELHELWFSVESASAQPPETREFIVSKEMDCSTRLLWENYRMGTQFPEIILEAYEPGGERRILQRIELRNVLIQSLETSDRLPDNLPVERIRWFYDWMRITSHCYRPTDGMPCGEHTFEYDFQNP